MGYSPSDMIREYNQDGDMWWQYDCQPFSGADPWDGDYDAEEDEDGEGPHTPRNLREYEDPVRFDVDKAEAEIKRLWQVQQDARERIGGEPWERDGRTGVSYYLWPESYFEVHPDGFITCDALQAYSYYEDGIAVSAEDWIRHKIAKAEAKADKRA